MDTSLSEPYSPLTPSILSIALLGPSEHRSYEDYLDSTRHFSRNLLYGPRRHIREERAESLRHRRVRENGVAEPRVWQVCQHRRLHRGHDLTGVGANHREAENAVVTPADKSLHEAALFVDRLRS